MEKPTERSVVSDLEKGNGSTLSQLFAGQFEQDRMQSFQRIQKMYKEDVASGRTKASLDFATSDFWTNQMGITDNKSGNLVYADTSDLSKGTHSETYQNAAGFQVKAQSPMAADRQPVDQKLAASVTADLERGDPTSLAKAMEGKMQEERASFLKAVSADNEADRKSKKTDVELDVSVQSFKHYTNQMNVYRSVSAKLFSPSTWNNPYSLWSDNFDMQTGKHTVYTSKDTRV
ncbi:MAG TPA: hypothetical protein V6C97_15695 [Oculatellaceae cyanobacterium]